MATDSVLRELEERLMRATGPDRDLDLALSNWTGEGPPWVWFNDDKTTVVKNLYGPCAPGNPMASMECFTATADDARVMVPSGCGISMVEPEDGPPYVSLYSKARGHIAHGTAKTLPLAILLASVRARLSSPSKE